MNNELCQGSAEWVEMRRKYIGASDAATIMGVSPWRTPLQLWNEKVNGIYQPVTKAMLRGTNMEKEALALYEEQTNQQYFQQVAFHSTEPFMMASLDGMSIDGRFAVEIKCPGEKTHALAVKGVVPEIYYPQLQHQMACSGLNCITYYSYNGVEGVAILVERDDMYIAEMIQKEREFWALVENKTPPETQLRDYVERDDHEWYMQSERLLEIEELLNELEREKETIKKYLIKISDGISTRGCGVTLTRSFRKGNVEYAKIPELKDIDLEQYRKPATEVWTLRLAQNNSEE